MNKTNWSFKIQWENRYIADNGSVCKVSVDGTDFGIYEPQPFSPHWYSHKINAAGVRYEVGIAIHTGWIVWIHGPFPCGEWSNLRIMRETIIYALDTDEYLLGDGGYNDRRNYTVTPTGINNYLEHMKSVVRARHETCNGRFKTWQILSNEFRHNISKHGPSFRAI